MCQRRPAGHLWYSDTFTVKPKKPFVVDWCVACGEGRTTEYGYDLTTTKPCKDCLAAFTEGVVKKMPARRVVPDSGGRCMTHWRAERLRRKAAAHEKRVQNTYGLEKGEYAKLYEFQGGRCALCRRATGSSKRLAVDHDHATGEVRGLCCGVCNKWILGHARDSIAFFRRCIRYLATTPYSLMRAGSERWVPPGE